MELSVPDASKNWNSQQLQNLFFWGEGGLFGGELCSLFWDLFCSEILIPKIQKIIPEIFLYLFWEGIQSTLIRGEFGSFISDICMVFCGSRQLKKIIDSRISYTVRKPIKFKRISEW